MFEKNIQPRTNIKVAALLVVVFVLGLTELIITFAATTPSLEVAATYGVLAGTYTNTSVATTVNGDIGFTVGPAAIPLGTHTNYGPGAPTPTARTDAANTLTVVNAESCDFNFGSITDLSLLPQPLVPGVYCIAAAASIGTGGITLSDTETYIFKITGAFTTVDNSAITLTGGASACNVFWAPTAATTLGADTTFAGTIIDNANAITVGARTTWTGRALSLGTGTVTTGDAVTITAPTCAAPQLTVSKTVVNDNDGTKVIADFPLFIDGDTVTSGMANTVLAGLHTISETTDAGYTAIIGGDCAADGTITLALGDVKTCTITNNDIVPPLPATLRVIKTVVNDNGGTSVASDFTIDVAGTNVSSSSFAGSEAGVDVTLDAGSYAVTETSLSGYLQSGSGNCSGTIAAGETKTCTITNDDIAPQLIVNKVVINDSGRTKIISDFPLFIDGGSVISGVATTATIGAHTVSETADSNYISTFGGDCAVDGTIILVLGDVKTCTVTNDDIAAIVVPVSTTSGGGGFFHYYHAPVPPLIDVVKVPSPLALPSGPGLVKYTYTLRNIGTVAVANVTMVGDTCSPLTLISGDTDADTKLDIDEIWIYTCSTTLSKTHTNIVTAIGWANGISATDIANATVIVGVPVVPPLIHVTKIPSPLVLSAGGGMVKYNYEVTNPGTVELANVRLADDKCIFVKYISGDTNDNSKLEITETWAYTCLTKLTKTTVNTVTASGDASGLTAKDFAIATVVVTDIPKLPNTGL